MTLQGKGFALVLAALFCAACSNPPLEKMALCDPPVKADVAVVVIPHQRPFCDIKNNDGRTYYCSMAKTYSMAGATTYIISIGATTPEATP